MTFVRLPIMRLFNLSLLAELLDVEMIPKFTIGDCREKLIHRYKTKTCKVQIKPWDKESIEDVKNIYTVVNMYKKDSHGKSIGEKEKMFA